MPPLQDTSCVTIHQPDMKGCQAVSGSLCYTANIVNQFNKLSVREESGATPNTTGEKTASSLKKIPASVSEREGKDVDTITNALQNINLASTPVERPIAVHKSEESKTSAGGKETSASNTEQYHVTTKSCPADESYDSNDENDSEYDESTETEGSEYESSSEEGREAESKCESKKRRNLIARGPDRRTRVCSKDRQAGGIVFTYPRLHAPSLPFESDQWWWSSFTQPQHVLNVNNVEHPTRTDLLDPITLCPEDGNMMTLPPDIVEEYLQQLENEGQQQPLLTEVDISSPLQPVSDRETEDEGFGTDLSPSSPESVSQNSFGNSTSSGVLSPLTSLPPSPCCSVDTSYTTYVPPKRHVPILPKPKTAREAILDQISQYEWDKARLTINAASEEKLMRTNDADGDTNLTVLMQFWESHKRPAALLKNHPLALLKAMVERMKFIKNGLSKKTLKGQNALHLAALYAYKDPLVARYIAEVMVECGEDVNAIDNKGDTVIHSVCRKGDTHIRVLESLLTIKKFDVNHTNSSGETPLEIAHSTGALEMFALLVANGARIDQEVYRQ